jgi:hypothetical protein
MAFRQTFRAPYGGDWQEIIQHHVKALNFGKVEIVIHDSRIVQVEITERFRFDEGRSPGASLTLPGQVPSRLRA